MAKSKCRLPDQFDGQTSATRFFTRFELACTLNKWETDAEKVGQLFPLLSDKVFDFVTGLSEDDKKVYATVKKKVLAEYEDVELEETYAEQFSKLRLGKEDDLGTFMAELKRLVAKGYPTFSEADRAKLVMNQFLKSLSSGARSHIMLQPKEETITMASCDEMLSKARLMHQIERTPSSSEGPRVAAVEAEGTNPQMDKVLSALEDLTKLVGESIAAPAVARVQDARQGQFSRSPQNRTAQFRGNCFKCGDKGHMARNCTRAVNKSRSVCGVCGNTGHEDRDCMLNRRSQKSCGICGNPGHDSKDCAMRGRRWPLNY